MKLFSQMMRRLLLKKGAESQRPTFYRQAKPSDHNDLGSLIRRDYFTVRRSFMFMSSDQDATRMVHSAWVDPSSGEGMGFGVSGDWLDWMLVVKSLYPETWTKLSLSVW